MINEPIDIPQNADTDEKKLAFLYRMKEKLRLQHNEKGESLPLDEFRYWQTTKFMPKIQRLHLMINKFRDQRKVSEEERELKLKQKQKKLYIDSSEWDSSIDIEAI